MPRHLESPNDYACTSQSPRRFWQWVESQPLPPRKRLLRTCIEPSRSNDEALTRTLVLHPGDGFKVSQAQRDDRSLLSGQSLKRSRLVRERARQAMLSRSHGFLLSSSTASRVSLDGFRVGDIRGFPLAAFCCVCHIVVACLYKPVFDGAGSHFLKRCAKSFAQKGRQSWVQESEKISAGANFVKPFRILHWGRLTT